MGTVTTKVQGRTLIRTFRTSFPTTRRIYAVSIDHLSHGQLRSFIEFIELVYRSRVRVDPTKAGDCHWLNINNMRLSETGLRVASRLYHVPIEGLAHQN